MPIHFMKECETLKKDILGVGALVQQSLSQAVKAVQERDITLAKKVIEGDQKIDEREIEVEEECLKLLALYHPFATDLRFIVAILKLNNDLERIGDLAVNIAQRSIFLSTQSPLDIPQEFPLMVEKVQVMVQKSLDSLVTQDAAMAKQVCEMDPEVDALNNLMYNAMKSSCQSHPDSLDSNIHLLLISRHLERIGDHATNIAEDVLYMLEGAIYRHRNILR